ncbi:MAG: SGNH/GDSL hydrolase family protein [Actinomycetota bacterium]
MTRRIAATTLVAVVLGSTTLAGPATTFAAPATDAPATAALVTVAPCRLYDSRATSPGGQSERVPARTEIVVDAAGRCGLPAGAVALVLSVTVTAPSRPGFVAVWPAGATPTATSALNFEGGETRANGAIVATGVNGAIVISASADAHLVVDVTGAFTAAERSRAGRFVPTPPTRLVDTRVSGSRRPAGSTIRIPLPAGVPSDATALAITIATSETSSSGYFTAHGAGIERPTTSLLNSDGPRQVRAAGQIVATGPEGIEVFSQTGDHVIVDFTGWFTGPSSPESGDGLFVPIAPTRIVDTRTDTVTGGIFPGGTIQVDPTDVAGHPVAAIAGNWTMTETRAAGYITAYPGRTERPLAATVNADRRRQNVAQFGIVAASSAGIAVFASNGNDLVVDATGWFTGDPLPTTTATDPPNTPAPDTARRVLLVGDSTLAGVRWYGNARHALVGSDFVLDVESCRRLVGTSCGGREGRRPPNAVQAIAAAEGTIDVVVIMTGYNDWYTTFSGAVDQVMGVSRAKGARRVVWLTYREGSAYRNPTGGTAQDEGFRIQNQILREKAASGAFPEMVVADYDAYTRATDGWFTSDGVHFTIVGAYGTADYISRVIAATHSEACPAPWTAGGAVETPCANPDRHAPLVDPLGLYSGNPNDIHCYEMGGGRQVACQVDPKLHLAPR